MICSRHVGDLLSSRPLRCQCSASRQVLAAPSSLHVPTLRLEYSVSKSIHARPASQSPQGELSTPQMLSLLSGTSSWFPSPSKASRPLTCSLITCFIPLDSKLQEGGNLVPSVPPAICPGSGLVPGSQQSLNKYSCINERVESKLLVTQCPGSR